MQSHIDHKSILRNEKGMVLAVTLMLIAILVLLGTTAVMTVTTDMKIAANYRSSTQAFYIAEAGLEAARNQLRTDIEASALDSKVVISNLLDGRKGANSTLSDSTNILNFYGSGAFVTDDVPYIAQTSFGSGTYSVYLTNDGTDGVTSLTDTNNKVTLTSIGQGPGNSLAILQEVVQKLTVPTLPGAVVLPGPNVIFNGANSNASGIAGDTESAISTTSSAAENTILASLSGPPTRLPNYTCEAGSGNDCINSEPTNFGPEWSTVAGIESLAATFRSAADTDIPGPGPYTLTAVQIGNISDRKIVYVDGDATIDSINGAGILIVTGQLTLKGNFSYNGLIMCIGKGSLYRSGAGSGQTIGSIFTAQTRDSSGNHLSTLGTPTFDTSGGGSSDIRYDASALSNAGGSKFVKKSWQQI